MTAYFSVLIMKQKKFQWYNIHKLEKHSGNHEGFSLKRFIIYGIGILANALEALVPAHMISLFHNSHFLMSEKWLDA